MKNIICVASRGRNPENPKSREPGLTTEQQLEPRFDNKTNCLTSVQKDNLVMSMKLGRSTEFQRSNTSGKAYALDCGGKDGFMMNSRIRRLTPRECMRLQTVPEHLIDKMMLSGTSDTQLYRMAGNGWTIDVIAYILSFFQIPK